MSDPPTDWIRIRDLFDEAAELPASARASFLDASGAAPAVRAEVEAMLRADTATSVLDLPAAEGAPDLVAGVEPAEAVPDRIGAWRPVREIGRGGMGAVYLAERADGAFRQTAALKRLAAGPSRHREALRRRFAQERQILASLDDPGIARLLDGGVADDGAPYLVMELVDGEPLTAWADARGLGVRERVELFVQVCDAVGTAHRHLVVHRDLKPSNVFVTDPEGPSALAPTLAVGEAPAGRPGAGRVKLLDFGIARLLDEAEPAAALTGTGAPLLTPEYAAPEQVRGGAVTTATDVYALGALLYELLAGRRPTEIRDRTLAGIVEAVCERTPPPPSDVAPAERRRALAGDLDTIVGKALAKEADQRYRSADALGDELRRWLGGLPIEARTPTARYRVGRFARRHRGAVATAAAAGLLLLVASVAYVVSLRAEQRRASRAAERAEQTSAFLVSLFGDADPAAVRGDTLTALDLLDRGVRRVDAELADQPALQAELYGVISDAYGSLGRRDLAVRFARRALGLLGGGVDPAGRVAAQVRLAGALGVARGAGSDSLYQDAVRQARALGEPGPLLDALYAWGMSTFDNRTGPQRATEILEEAIGAHREAFGDGDPRVALLTVRLASVVPDLGDYERAIALLRDALGQLPADGFPRERASALVELGEVLYYANGKAEAIELLREAVQLRTELYGPDHPSLVSPLKALGVAYIADEPDAAEALLRRGVRILEAAPDPDSTQRGDLSNMHSSLHNLFGRRGDYETALVHARRALELAREIGPPESPVVSINQQLYALALSKAGRHAEAREAWDRSMALARAVYGPRSAVTLMNHNRAGAMAIAAGEAERAERILAAADSVARAALPASSHTRAELAYRLGRVRLDGGRPEAALEPLRRAVAARDVLGRVGVDHHPEATSMGNIAEATLGRALLAAGRFEAAERHLARAAPALRDSLGDDAREVRLAVATLRDLQRQRR